MNIKTAEALARSLMDAQGLVDWKFKFDGAKKRFGQCNYAKKTISLSLYLTVLNDEADVRDCILHEIAHAIAGFEAGHGHAWQSKALQLGANPNRTYDGAMVKSVEGRWIAYCPVHGALSGPRHRRSKNRVCKRCRHPVEWRERG